MWGYCVYNIFITIIIFFLQDIRRISKILNADGHILRIFLWFADSHILRLTLNFVDGHIIGSTLWISDGEILRLTL